MTDPDLPNDARDIREPILVFTAEVEDDADTRDATAAAFAALTSADPVTSAMVTVADGSDADSWVPTAVPEGDHPNDLKAKAAYRRAKENVERWGQQTTVAVLMALAEEVAELIDEVVPEQMNTGDDSVRESWLLLRQMHQTGEAVRVMLESVAEDEDGEPLPDGERPPLVPERADMDVDDVRDELYDLMALGYQLDWSLYQGERERDRQ